jgi:hypothetical protein
VDGEVDGKGVRDMEGHDRVEVTIRAAQIAKTVLGLLEVTSVQGAYLRMAEVARQCGEMHECLARIEAFEKKD